MKRLDQLHSHVPGQVMAMLIIVPATVFHPDLNRKTQLGTMIAACDVMSQHPQSKGDCLVIHGVLDIFDH